MKNIILIILGLTLIQFSCTKEAQPQPVQLKPDCLRVDSVLDHYADNWDYIRSDTAYTCLSMCGEDLKRWQAYPRLQRLCGENTYRRFVFEGEPSSPLIFNVYGD